MQSHICVTEFAAVAGGTTKKVLQQATSRMRNKGLFSYRQKSFFAPKSLSLSVRREATLRGAMWSDQFLRTVLPKSAAGMQCKQMHTNGPTPTVCAGSPPRK
jgi:hypothetical protein